MKATELNEKALVVLNELLEQFDELSNNEPDTIKSHKLANIGRHIIMTMDYIKATEL